MLGVAVKQTLMDLQETNYRANPMFAAEGTLLHLLTFALLATCAAGSGETPALLPSKGEEGARPLKLGER